MEMERVAVAYSGGRDSTALLHATMTAAAELGLQVIALHVHHGLNSEADRWLRHCESQCAKWARRGLPVELVAHRLISRPAPGASVEAWAREARYQALERMALARNTSVVLLAHHRRDQAETVLLQALRGAGLAGLSAMPASAVKQGFKWLRPWLAQPRERIEGYVRRYRLSYVDDPSNDDLRFARNRLRSQVWPALVAAFPQAEASLAMAAAWAQQAATALHELAALDLAAVADDDGLHVARWQALSAARRGNALRSWLKQCRGLPAPASLVERLSLELAGSRGGARWPVEGGELRNRRGVLRFAPPPHATLCALPREATLSIHRAGGYALPGWAGQLVVKNVDEGGVPLAWLGQLELKARAGGERFQTGPGRLPRSLKKQYQTADIPVEGRHGPLVFSGGQLVYVPGLGLDARLVGLPGQNLVSIQWLPTGPDEAGRCREDNARR